MRAYKDSTAASVVAETIQQGLDPRMYRKGLARRYQIDLAEIDAEIERQAAPRCVDGSGRAGDGSQRHAWADTDGIEWSRRQAAQREED